MLELHHDWDSVCSFKVRFALHEKGVDWQSKRVDLIAFENLKPGYTALNPNGVVPTLVHDGAAIVESTIINEYIDEVFIGPALVPKDPLARARMRILVKYQDDVLYWSQRPASFQLMIKQRLATLSKAEIDALVRSHPEPQRAQHFINWATGPVDMAVVTDARQKLTAVLERLEKALADGRTWLVGDQLTLAEAAYAPFVDRLDWLGFDDLWREKPAVARWFARIRARPAFATSCAPAAHRLPKPVAWPPRPAAS